ncbi:MAG: hypothetical protein LBB38_02645 [Puniceicoccales bacterium]|jgi:Ser/Thr protein kinase RdoA (MazF antagonist)|nr:hypothetical protein [Puniceicoccales bacterium]
MAKLLPDHLGRATATLEEALRDVERHPDMLVVRDWVLKLECDDTAVKSLAMRRSY